MKIPHLLCSTEHSCVSLATGSDQSSQLYGWNPSPTLSHLPHSPGFWKLFWGPHKVQSPQPGPIKRPAQCSTRLQASPGTARGTNRRGGWAWRGSGWPRLGSVGPSASPASQALLLLFRPLFSLFTVNSCAKKPGRCHPVTSRGWVRGSPAERRFEGVEKKNACFSGQLCEAYSPHTCYCGPAFHCLLYKAQAVLWSGSGISPASTLRKTGSASIYSHFDIPDLSMGLFCDSLLNWL